MPAERRLGHLVAYAATLEAGATDDVLTVLDEAIRSLLFRIERYGKRRPAAPHPRRPGPSCQALREAWL